MKRVYKECVFKRDWRFYKTCYECPSKCTEYRPKWYARLIEAIVVWWYRKRINRRLKKTFNGIRLDLQTIRRIGKKMK